MTLPPDMGMDVDDIGGNCADNYNDVRGCTMTSKKMASRTVSMSLSEASVDYATKMEHLNDIPDNVETREPIDSSQLSYAEPKKIQVSGATDHENRARMQCGLENAPALMSTLPQHVDIMMSSTSNCLMTWIGSWNLNYGIEAFIPFHYMALSGTLPLMLKILENLLTSLLSILVTNKLIQRNPMRYRIWKVLVRLFRTSSLQFMTQAGICCMLITIWTYESRKLHLNLLPKWNLSLVAAILTRTSQFLQALKSSPLPFLWNLWRKLTKFPSISKTLS